MAKKMTKAQQAAAAKAKAELNPITKKPANSYTQAEGVTLDAPKGAREVKAPTDPYVAMTQRRARSRAKDFADSREGRIINDVPGYGSVDLDAPGWNVDHSLNEMGQHFFGFKGNKYTPNVTSGPAVNEPHVPHAQAMVGRRAEDLSGPEHRKGTEVLKAYGVTEQSAAREIKNANDRANMRSVLAGADHVAGSGFYGGPSEPNDVMKTVEQKIVKHPNFKGTDEDAWAITATANALTSPKAPFEQVYKDGRPKAYPNNAAADTAVTHALAGGDPKTVPQAPLGGIHGNTVKAAEAARDMLRDPGDPKRKTVRDLFTWTKQPKTGSYVSAHTEASTPDSYRVSDVHSTRSAAPHLSSEKSHKFNVVDAQGNVILGADGKRISHQFEAEDIGADGLPGKRIANQRLKHYGLAGHRYEVQRDEDGKPVKGNSPVEEMLSRAGAPGHAILDRAGRIAAHQMGKTPSIHHAQAQNQVQEVDWREQQVTRPDLPYNSETEYPGGQAKMGMTNDFNVFDHKTWGVGQQFKGRS